MTLLFLAIFAASAVGAILALVGGHWMLAATSCVIWTLAYGLWKYGKSNK